MPRASVGGQSLLWAALWALCACKTPTQQVAPATLTKPPDAAHASGLAPGDRVLIRLPHSPAYAFAFFAANLAGLVPISVWLRSGEPDDARQPVDWGG